MKKIFKNILSMVALCMCSAASAQNLNSAYFLDGYTYGHQLNPAKEYDRNGYVSFPMLGNINVGMTGNLALTDILKFNGNQLTTFMNPNIPVKDALSGFSSNNNINMGLNMEILSFGFHAFGGYNTFNVALRSNFGINVPYEIFEFAKNITNKDYDISDLSASAMLWGEVGLGHSRQVTEAWRVGAKAKFLIGGAKANLRLKNAHLNLAAPDKWVLDAEAVAEVNVKGFDWGEPNRKQDINGNYYDEINFANVGLKSTGPNGYGLAFDLGAEWDLGKQGWVDGLKVSASVLDLGFISWDESHKAYNRGKRIEITGFKDIPVGGGEGTSIEDQTEGYEGLFTELVSLENGGVSKSTSAMGVTMNIAAEYKMPFYKKLSVGILSTTRFQGEYTWNEERIVATVSPVKWFELSANVAFGTRGTSFGWVANIHPRGFNVFVGMDHVISKLSKQYIPLKSNADITIGVNIPFGKSRID